MQDLTLAISGLACLVITGLGFYKLAPREGEQTNPWMEREMVAMTVTLVLLVLGLTGIGLVIKAVA